MSIFANGFNSTLKDITIKEVECDGTNNEIKISKNQKSYINFGFKDLNNFANGIFQKYEGKYNEEVKNFNFINHIEGSYPLKNGVSYKIKFTCTVVDTSSLKKNFIRFFQIILIFLKQK